MTFPDDEEKLRKQQREDREMGFERQERTDCTPGRRAKSKEDSEAQTRDERTDRNVIHQLSLSFSPVPMCPVFGATRETQQAFNCESV